MGVTILGIESSCDDTSAAVIRDGYLMANVISSQDVHRQYGGVVPELASRAHQANIIPVVDGAIKRAGASISEIDAIAFTQGPGLLGSLLVGSSFAKGFALANGIPMVAVNHLQGHVLAHFIRDEVSSNIPELPLLCLLVSGGHTQLILVESPHSMSIIGQTIDDAAGEAFDKCAKVMGLPYPGGPVIDRLAKEGNPHAFSFAKPAIKDLDFSFSGLKTSFLYTLRDMLRSNPNFVQDNLANLCASLQRTIIEILLKKLEAASSQYGVTNVAIAGGVSANSGLRSALSELGAQRGWTVHLPQLRYTTDNAAMIAIVGYYKYLSGEFAQHDVMPMARMSF